MKKFLSIFYSITISIVITLLIFCFINLHTYKEFINNLQQILRSTQHQILHTTQRSAEQKNNTVITQRITSIQVDLQTQTLTLLHNNQKIKRLTISSGKNNWTPIGKFQVIKKSPMVYSRKYDCWLPFWISFTKDGRYGFHELPICNSKAPIREGVKQIGAPSSHGCIRLNIGDAEELYNLVQKGTQITIQ